MKKYGKFALLMAGLLGITMTVTGCQVKGDTISLIKEPILSKKQEDVKKALEKLLPPGAELVAPDKAKKKQSIFMEDIDSDGKIEVFATYRGTKDNQQVHLLVLKERDGKWSRISDIATDYFALDYFNIENLDGVGKKEVIMGVGPYKYEMGKQLATYEWQNNKLIKKVQNSYEAVDIADYIKGGRPEILLLDGERNKQQTAGLYSYEDGKLKLLSFVELNPYGYYENIVSGKLSDGKRALFVDSGLGAHSMLTEIVFYHKGKLIKLGDEDDGFLFKAYPLYSRDINGDGVIEAGGMYIPKGYEDAPMAGIPFIHVYADYREDGTKKVIEERYVNGEKRFYVTIPAKWHHKVTIENINQGIRLISTENQKILFEVKWADKKSYDSDLGLKLLETKDTVFYTDRKEKMLISNNNFHLLQDEF